MRFLIALTVVAGITACGNKTAKPAPQPASADAFAAPRTDVLAVPAAPTPTSAVAPAAAAPDGRALFTKYCVLCHGRSAQGYAADNAPSLMTETFRATATPAFLREAINRGRPGTAMAAYGVASGGPLAEADVDALLAFLRTDAPALKPLPTEPIVGNGALGKKLFDIHCTKCHGTPMQRGNAIHLFNQQLMATASDAFLRYAIVHGRPGTPMEAWEKKLSSPDIDHLVVYLRSLAVSILPPPPVLEQPPAQALLPWDTSVVINPHGKQATLKPREERFAALDDVNKALEEKRRIIILDARSPGEWMRLHITGSLSLPYYVLETATTPADIEARQKYLDKLPNDGTWIIAYCACPHHASGVVVDELRKRGYKTTAVLDEGVFAWQQKKYPVVAADGALPVPAPPRQALENPTAGAPPVLGTHPTPAVAAPQQQPPVIAPNVPPIPTTFMPLRPLPPGHLAPMRQLMPSNGPPPTPK